MSGMWMISDRKNFWNPDEVSLFTQLAYVKPDGSMSSDRPNFNSLKGKKVLLLVHGFDNDKNSAIQAYHQIQEEVHRYLQTATAEKLYDVVIGYLWPGGANPLEYEEAKYNVMKLPHRMNVNLLQLHAVAAKVDVMAHSMGNRLIYEALKKPLPRPLIQNLFSLAPAVNEESIEQGYPYSNSMKNCHRVFVFHSQEDAVLRFLYTVAEFDQALGFEGVEDPEKLPKNVQLVDCTDIVEGHGNYRSVPTIYGFIRKHLLGLLPAPEHASRIKLVDHEQVDILHRESFPIIKTAIAATLCAAGIGLLAWKMT